MNQPPDYIREEAEKRFPVKWVEKKMWLADGVYDANEKDRSIFIAGAMFEQEHWVKEKPKFQNDCLLLTAIWFKDHWEYECSEIKYVEGYGEDGSAWYWGVFELDGEEWGDLADLKADLYKVIKPLPTPPKE